MGNKTDAWEFLVEYINKNEQPNLANWYAGIAADVEQRLFGDHNVSKKNGIWAHYPCDSDSIARDVEAELLAAGLDGGGGGGDHTTKTVYVYVKTGGTDP